MTSLRAAVLRIHHLLPPRWLLLAVLAAAWLLGVHGRRLDEIGGLVAGLIVADLCANAVHERWGGECPTCGDGPRPKRADDHRMPGVYCPSYLPKEWMEK